MDRTPQVLPVRSLREALGLYRDGLGLALVQLTLDAATLQIPTTGDYLELRLAPGRASAEIPVDDLPSAVAAVLRKGGEVRSSLLRAPADRHVICLDTDGNRLQLIERSSRGRR
jgi:catechol 2,3-dioxygenase-like lactoylglutathione lyase family enzyme